MTKDRVLVLIQDCFDSLKTSGLIETSVQVNDQTALLGPGSVLDSIAFVTFVVELEDRINQEIGQELSMFNLAINEIHEFNPDKTALSAGTLAEYTVKATTMHG